jgi:hypothetical protein
MSELRITTDDDGVVHLAGPVTIETTPEASFALRASRGAITIDVSAVTSFDDSGAALIMRRLGRGPVTLQGVPSVVIDALAWARMLELPGLTIERGADT